MPEFSDAIVVLKICLERMASISEEYIAENISFNTHNNEFAKNEFLQFTATMQLALSINCCSECNLFKMENKRSYLLDYNSKKSYF